MVTPTTPTLAQKAAPIFAALQAAILADVLSNGSNLLTGFFNGIKATPTSQSVVAQGIILAANAPMQLPALEGEALTQVANAGLALVALLNAPSS